jgi:hypothetical protein
MGDMLPKHLPASQQSAFFWRGEPSVIGARLHAPKRKPNRTPNHITLTDRDQGQRDADRNQALRMGSI